MPINAAILGAGLFAKLAHLPALQKLTDTYQLKAVYSRSQSSASTLAKSAESLLSLPESSLGIYHDEGDPEATLDVLLASDTIQAVIVILPITLQPSIILKALEAGKHVLSEKPVAPDVKSGLDLIDTYENKYKGKGLIWRVAENFEAEPGLREAGKLIREQKIGKVYFWNHQVLNCTGPDSIWYKTPWRTVPDYQGGFLLDGGVHSAAALRVILPSPLKELSGFASLNRPHLAPQDTIHALIRSEDGSHGVFELSFGLPTNPGVNTFRVTGSEGTLTLGYVHEKDEKTGSQKSSIKITIVNLKGETEEILEECCGVKKELENFAAHIGGTDDGLGSPKNALLDVAVIQAGLNSNGTSIDLIKLVSSK